MKSLGWKHNQEPPCAAWSCLNGCVWFLIMTRLETRTKELLSCASARVENPSAE